MLDVSKPGAVQVWDADKGQEVLTLLGHTGRVTSVCFSPDGRRLASASFDQTVRVWDADKGRPVLTLQGHTYAVTSVCFSPDGQRVFSWDAKGKVLSWTVRDGRPTEPVNPPPRPEQLTALSPDGKQRLFANGNDVQLIDLALSQRRAVWPLPDRAERLRYHAEQARLAEEHKQWFAAAFHLGRLLQDQPDDADLKRRQDAALKNYAVPPLTPMEPAPP
jgi:WD40 repeat protein